MSLVVPALLVAGLGLFVSMAYRRRWQWTGLPATSSERPAKTLWDWLQLLGIPIALAALAFLLNDAQGRRDAQREDGRAGQQRGIAADAEREDTLRSYFEQMSELMLDRQLQSSSAGSVVRNVARTATLTAVRRLDGPRRSLVVRFLVEAQLLRATANGPRVELASAVLRGVDLRSAYLPKVDLSRVDLSEADLRRAVPPGTTFQESKLVRANLSQMRFAIADFSGANLRDANLSKADLAGANFDSADLSHADLRGARFYDLYGRRANLSHARLNGADLRGARLGHTNLRWADLRDANLNGVDLRKAKLDDANLRGADLRGAKIRRADLRRARGSDPEGANDKSTGKP